MIHPVLTLIPDPHERDKVVVYGACSCCKKQNSHSYKVEGLQRWLQGTLIQIALSEVSPAWREWLKTAICDVCWDGMMDELFHPKKK